MLWCVSSATAQESPYTQWQKTLRTLRVSDWKKLKVQQELPNCQIISMDGISVLEIQNTNNAPLEVSLLKVSDPTVIKKAFFIPCEIKYDNVNTALIEQTNNGFHGLVSASGRLTFLNHIPPSAAGGDERTNMNYYEFQGTSNWKKYEFTIDRTAGEGLPTQLELKLSLASSGTVYLRPIKLLGVVGSWWSPQQIGLIGGIGGSVIGCFGALLGLLASKGKARNFVLTTMKIFIVLGILLTIAGFVAVVCKQPYAVWYALLLPGVILTLVFSLNLPSIQRRYDELEIRRMTSVDTMGS
jgi:hypothetical protein